MGLFDVVTKPFEAAKHVVDSVVDTAKDVAHDAVDAAKDIGHAASDAATSIADAKGWAGLAWRLNPITGPILQGVDTIKAGADIASGKPGASIWDIPALGFAKGFGEGAVDLVKGVGYLGLTSIKSSPFRAIVDPEGFVDQWKQNLGTADYVLHHPLDVAKAIVKPITDDVDANRYYEVEGRGAFEVLNVIFGAKGANKVAEAIGLAGKGAEAAGTAGRVAEGAGELVDDAARTAEGVDDAARAADAAGDAAHAADAAGDAAAAARAANAKLLDELAPGLNAEERAFAEQVDVAHIFKGDADGGLHWTPGEGTFDGVEVRAVKPPKPNSTWRAEVTIDGVTKESTMFPREWSPEDVLRAIKEARANGEAANAVRAGNLPGTKVITGESRGIKIRIVVDEDSGRVITANPSQAGKAFTP